MAHKRNVNSKMPAPEVPRIDEDVEVQQRARRIPLEQSIPNMTTPSTTNSRPTSINTIIKMGEGIKLSPDHLLSPNLSTARDSTYPYRNTTRMPSALPTWLWCLLSFGLGISRDKPLAKIPKFTSLALRVLTMVTGLCFGICGLVINAHEALDESTKTTALVCFFKSAVGMFWVLLGIYSHSLAVRSFSSKGLQDYIRLHSKTFMKISSVVWISLLCILVMAANIYSNKYLLEDKTPVDGNVTDIIDPTCNELDLNIALCEVYFYSKTVFSCLNLAWILAVAAVCLSVCRTHAVCMRRFMRELSYDCKIYEEFSKLKLSMQQEQLEDMQESLNEYDSHHDEVLRSKNPDVEPTSNRKRVWGSLRKIRDSKMLGHAGSIKTTKDMGFSHIDEQDDEQPQIDELNEREDSAHDQGNGIVNRVFSSKDSKPKDVTDGAYNCDPSPRDQEEKLIQDLSTMKKAPILNNTDLMFTYFKIVKHLSTTSRLLQRWMSSSILFVMAWCIFLAIYWASNTIKLVDLFQFVAPLAVLGLLISAYAEVNLEGYLLPKYMLPTEDRLPVLYYVHNRPLELKVYSFVLTFNILATFVVGIAVAFASRIIFDKIK